MSNLVKAKADTIRRAGVPPTPIEHVELNWAVQDALKKDAAYQRRAGESLVELAEGLGMQLGLSDDEATFRNTDLELYILRAHYDLAVRNAPKQRSTKKGGDSA